MRALIFDGPGRLHVENIQRPAPGPGEVTVGVHRATICGTDVRIVSGRKTREVRRGVPIGHECAGTVDAIGEGVSGLAPGDRVGVCVVVSCGACDYCHADHENLCASRYTLGYRTDGAFAETMRIPAEAVARGNLFRLPDGVSCDIAPLLEPMACCINGQHEMDLHDGMSRSLLILGGGPIGLLHLLIARAKAEAAGRPMKITLVEPRAHRREMAQRLGAERAIKPGELTEVSNWDAVILAVGVPELVSQALTSVRRQGKVNLFAGFDAGVTLPIDPNVIHYRQIHLTGASESRRRDYAEALEMVDSGSVDVTPLITHRYPLEAYNAAFHVAESGEALKVAFDIA